MMHPATLGRKMRLNSLDHGITLKTVPRFDVVIVGGGIIGLAAAREILMRRPSTTLAVVDKEPAIGEHQTGHNSGVLHSGIYYKPGSLKAVTCRAGKRAMEKFCAAEGVPFEICGKVVVAVDDTGARFRGLMPHDMDRPWRLRAARQKRSRLSALLGQISEQLRQVQAI